MENLSHCALGLFCILQHLSDTLNFAPLGILGGSKLKKKILPLIFHAFGQLFHTMPRNFQSLVDRPDMLYDRQYWICGLQYFLQLAP